jgi:phosphatidylglycerol:prolipoprotein diacylglycerol transferase
MGSIPLLAFAIDWGWIKFGPYIGINIDPVILHIGPLALRWYGLMYVVAIVIALYTIRGYAMRKGMSEDMIYRFLWWCIAAGLIGGRLYFVIQQPNFFSYYLAQPQHILATWEGGMAFFGAVFLGIATLIWRARAERINALVAIDAGVLFAAVGQIFGRIGNLINGDIIGYASKLPWSTVYLNPNSWACLNPATCNVPVQPAAAYELLTNLVLLAVMLYLAKTVRRPGILMIVYLFGYATTQFLLFFVRDNLVVPFLGLNWGLKQAQWTSIVLFIAMIPISILVLRSRYSRPVPVGENASTYGIPQKEKPVLETDVDESATDNERPEGEDADVSDQQTDAEALNEEPSADGADSEETANEADASKPADKIEVESGHTRPTSENSSVE